MGTLRQSFCGYCVGKFNVIKGKCQGENDKLEKWINDVELALS